MLSKFREYISCSLLLEYSIFNFDKAEKVMVTRKAIRCKDRVKRDIIIWKWLYFFNAGTLEGEVLIHSQKENPYLVLYSSWTKVN